MAERKLMTEKGSFSSNRTLGGTSPILQESRPSIMIERQNRVPKSVIDQAITKNPDAAAKELDAARRLAVQPGTSSDRLKQLQDQARSRNISTQLRGSPLTTELFYSREVADRAHDDVGSLTAMERLGNAWEKGQLEHEIGYQATKLKFTKDPQIRAEVTELQKKLASIGHDTEGGFVSWLGSALTMSGQMSESFASRQAVVLIGGGAGGGALLGALGGPAAFATIPGGFVAGGTAGLITHILVDSFAVEGGHAYLEMLQEGVDDDVATLLSSGVGIVNAALELGSASIVLAPFSKGVKSMMKKGIREALKDKRLRDFAAIAVKQYGAGIAGEVTTEMLQEIVQMFGTEIAKDMTDENLANITQEEITERLTGVMLETTKAMVFMAAPGPGFNMAVNVHKAKQAQTNAQTLDLMKDVVDNSKLKERAPDIIDQHIKNIMDSKGMKSVFVPARHLAQWVMQSSDPKGLLQALGVERKIEEEIILDGDVEISNDRFAQYILQNDLFEGIKDHIRMTEDAMTPAEAKEYQESGLREEIQQSDREAAMDRILERAGRIRKLTEAAKKAVEKKPQQLPEIEEDFVELEDQHLDPEDRGFVSNRIEGIDDVIEEQERQAAEDEVAIAEGEIGLRAFFETADEAGMTPAQYQKYLVNLQKARDRAVANKQDKVLKEKERSLTKQWRKEYAGMLDQARESLSNVPVYQAFNAIGPVRLNRAEVEEVVTTLGKTLDDLPKQKGRNIYTDLKKEPGVGIDVFAELYGYTSGADMILEFLTVEPINVATETLALRRMNQKHGTISDTLMAVREARKALHNDSASKALEAELNALRKSNGKKRVSNKLIRRAAIDKLGEYKVREIRPHKFLFAQSRLAKKAARALRKGDRVVAEQLKLQQLMNFEMARQAFKLQDKIQKDTRLMSRYAGDKPAPNVSPSVRKAIHQLLERVTFRPKKSDEKITELLNEANSAVDPVKVRKEILEEHARLSYKDMTYSEFKETADTVRELVRKSVQENRLRKKAEQAQVDTIVSRITDAMERNLNFVNWTVEQRRSYNHQKTVWEEAKGSVREVGAYLFSADTVLRYIDGWENLGFAYEMLKGRVDDALSRGYQPGQRGYFVESQEAAQKLQKLYEVFTIQERKQFDKLHRIPGLHRDISMNERIAILLHSGNAENIQALLDSGMTQQELDVIWDYSTERDWDFAQSVWDFFETFWPAIKAKEEQRRNYTPEKVEALPFERTFDGKTKQYAGGYAPLRYRRHQGMIEEIEPGSTEDLVEQLRRGEFVTSHTRRGHTEKRTGNPGHPLNLDVYIVQSHIDQVIYDLEVGDALADFVKILHNKDMKEAFIENNAEHLWTQLDLWFRDAVTREIGINNKLEKALRHIRTGFTVSKLGWNVGVVALQVLGVMQTAVQVGKLNTAHAMYDTMNPKLWFGKDNIFDWVSQQSGFMMARLETYNKDILDAQRVVARNHLLDKITPGTSADIIRGSLFWGIKKTQRWTDTVTWLAAKRQGLAEGMSETDAIRHADRMVSRTQASGVFTERTPLERGTLSPRLQQTELVRAFTPLISFFMAKNNVAFERTKKTNFKNVFEFAHWMADMMLLYSAEALLATLIRGQWPDDDDEQVQHIVGTTVSQVVAGLPAVREAIAVAQGFTGTGGVPGAFLEDFGKALKQTGQAELDEALLRAWANTAGTLLKWPTSQSLKTGTAIAKAADGEDVMIHEFFLGPQRD